MPVFRHARPAKQLADGATPSRQYPYAIPRPVTDRRGFLRVRACVDPGFSAPGRKNGVSAGKMPAKRRCACCVMARKSNRFFVFCVNVPGCPCRPGPPPTQASKRHPLPCGLERESTAKKHYARGGVQTVRCQGFVPPNCTVFTIGRPELSSAGSPLVVAIFHRRHKGREGSCPGLLIRIFTHGRSHLSLLAGERRFSHHG